MNPEWDDLDDLASRLDAELDARHRDPRRVPPRDLARLTRAADRLNELNTVEPRPAFARKLEADLLARARANDHPPLTVIPARRPARRTRAWALHAIPIRVALVACIVLAGIGLLSIFTAIAHAGTPLYPLQRAFIAAIGADQTSAAQADLQQANAALKRFAGASSIGDNANAGAALTQLTKANQAVEQAIQHETDRTQRNTLQAQYNDLRNREQSTLSHALSTLSWPTRMQVTSIMRGLGAPALITVIGARVTGVKASGVAKSSGQMTISISGANFQPGAVLLVNGVNFGQVSAVTSSLIIAHLPAGRVSHIDSIGVGLPDGTAAMTYDVEFGGHYGDS
jgi:hypothetical protein